MGPFDLGPKFRPIFQQYSETWDIVSSPASCALMRDMAEIKYAVVDAMHHVPGSMELAWGVHDYDDDDGSFDMYKKMVGSMCRQVMDQLGYKRAKQNDTVLSPVFDTGMSYRFKEDTDVAGKVEVHIEPDM